MNIKVIYIRSLMIVDISAAHLDTVTNADAVAV